MIKSQRSLCEDARDASQESQEVSPFQAGDHKATRNGQDSMTDKHETQVAKMIHKRSTALERSGRFKHLFGDNFSCGSRQKCVWFA